MDRVRFGRALGYGARHAVRALKNAAEAAAAEPAPVSPTPRPAAQAAVPAQPQAPRQETKATQAGGSKRSVLAPLKEFSGTVLLQVMGTIFGLFALVLSQAVWRLRGAFRPPYNSSDAMHLYLASGMFLLFAWFTVSSFIRAARVGRH